MKYRDILDFEPITEIVQFDKLDDKDYQKELIHTFVYPDYFLDVILSEIVKNTKFGERNQKGIQIIGNYGTGKSHLMSLVQLIAEYPEYLDEITNEKAREVLKPISGKFKVHRFELAHDGELWDLVKYQLQVFLDKNDVDYHFEENSPKMYNQQFDDMMAAFEAKYPNHGFMLVIDEMLAYLKGRVSTGGLNRDLQVLQTLGQACARSRFSFMFGVQEMIYQSREFAFAAEMLLHVQDRFRDLTIRKEEVSFIVQNRLLKKSADQKSAIRTHLNKYVQYYSDMHAKLEEYVNLFPVHPSYFDNFQKIRLGKSQREVLKTLSKQFQLMKDNDVPTDNPGLITYDMYWEQLMKETSIMSIPDFKTVSDTVKTVHDKIDNNFEGGRAKQKPLAKRIVNACAIKILQDTLDKRNGARAEILLDDLCCTFPIIEDRNFLVDQVENCANLITKATSGQYFEMNEDNQEYRLRTEGGINFDQQITQYAETMSPMEKDQYFYKFITQIMEITSNPYRSGFEIYQHEIMWKSHKVSRNGYIFLGGANDKSTTHPKQHFYMIFMPIFQHKEMNLEKDEVYFVMDGLSQEFKNAVCLYGAAFVQQNSADSSQKPIYRAKMEDLFKKVMKAFDACYMNTTKVFYAQNPTKILKDFTLPPQGASKLEIFDGVASQLFETKFNEEAPAYPKFVNLIQPMTNDNRDRYIKAAIAKIARPTDANRDGEAILTGLGCYNLGEINVDNSDFAKSIYEMMDSRDPQKVINKDEILRVVENSENMWVTKDYNIESDLEFLVLAALVYLGECDLRLSDGSEINASNLAISLKSAYESHQDFLFAHVKRPRGANLPLIRLITTKLCGEDLSNKLEKADTYDRLVNVAKVEADAAQTFIGRQLQHGEIRIGGVVIYNEDDVKLLRDEITIYSRLCDKLKAFTSEARIKNLQYEMPQIQTILCAKDRMVEAKKKISVAKRLNEYVVYLKQAEQYVAPGVELAMKIANTTAKFDEILANPNETQVEQYEAELMDMKAKYIEWYLGKYKGFCINETQEARRAQILNSPTYRVCSELINCSILNTAAWTNWRSMFSKLKVVSGNAENQLQDTPCVNGFNPRMEQGDMMSIHELAQDLDDIYSSWVQALRDFINSCESQESLKLMGQQAIDFATGFTSGLIPMDNEITARTMNEFIKSMCKGFEEVEMTVKDLTSYFNRPMSMAEARATFDKYIFRICSGKKEDKVRIIFKSDN